MKKIFTLLALAVAAANVSATDYTDALTVDVNGSVMEQTATIGLTEDGNGKYIFTLNNFVMEQGGQKLGVGNIVLNNVEGTADNGVITLRTSQTTRIAAGDDATVDTWIGPMLNDVPIVLVAEQRGSKLYAVIDIDMSTTLGQVIKVTFGNGGYQIANSGFENYHTYTVNKKDVDEALSWHSFASAKGNFLNAANMFSSNPHTFVSDITRPGSQGQKSLLVLASSVMGITANGTITTGQMNAGAMSATDTKNHAEMDMSATATDGNGDPYYAAMNGRPDSLVVWLKYRQGTPDANYPYATVSAAITDGTYYQDPQDKEYSNVLATAKNAQIESNGYAWQRISIPFEYVDENIQGKAILVTISTNATPGKGSATDSIYVDDFELIYNSGLASAKFGDTQAALQAGVYEYTIEGAKTVKADEIEATANGKGAKIEKTTATEGDDIIATVKVTSNDLKNSSTYKFTLKGAAVSAIHSAKTDSNAKLKAIYNVEGKKVSQTRAGEVYIKVYDNGKAEKVIEK